MEPIGERVAPRSPVCRLGPTDDPLSIRSRLLRCSSTVSMVSSSGAPVDASALFSASCIRCSVVVVCCSAVAVVGRSVPVDDPIDDVVVRLWPIGDSGSADWTQSATGSSIGTNRLLVTGSNSSSSASTIGDGGGSVGLRFLPVNGVSQLGGNTTSMFPIPWQPPVMDPVGRLVPIDDPKMDMALHRHLCLSATNGSGLVFSLLTFETPPA